MQLTVIRFIILVSLLSGFSAGQTDNARWEKNPPTYLVPGAEKKRDFSINETNILKAAAKVVIIGYWFFISDPDGDRCPFHPSCSTFLVESIRMTNPVQGVLMFFDRFTRDTNVFERDKHYARDINRKRYYDHPSSYTLNPEDITYRKPGSFVKQK